MNSQNDSDCFEMDEATQSLESIASLTQKINFLEIMIQHLNTRVSILEGKELIHGNVMATAAQDYPVSWNLKTPKDYIVYAEKKIHNLKHDNEWRKNFLTINFDGVTSENKERILQSINKSRISISHIVNTIAKETIGINILSTHSLGSHGMAIINSSPGKASRPTIDETLENKLRSVVGFIDQIFVSRDGWEYLVRRPVNQMGREFKSGKRSLEESFTGTSKSTAIGKDGHNMAISNPSTPIIDKTTSSNAETTSLSRYFSRNDGLNRLQNINQIYNRPESGLLPRALFHRGEESEKDKERQGTRSLTNRTFI
ncbi:uncharacterized protein LOC107367215 [Tetranychus urticae]|uniref:Uncharacterized protein n=1 Tax=Tetranychus urticae TaxID=32264 RepID=T1KTX8_TETUR|nr:uncharacterized protein LOC107367215 [Tetranychus urticae]